MKMKNYLIVGLGMIIGWNIFLIQRDIQLFESYNQPQMEKKINGQ